MRKINILCQSIALLALSCSAAYASAETLLKVDASKKPAEIISGHFKMGTATSPTGGTLSANSLYLTKDGKPWFPLMGEFHYTRVPEQFWEEEILKVKASGLDVIATYVIWNHHEENAGKFNWSGDRNLREFLSLCKKHDMKVVLRIGPWAHGEVRYGGSPDWVVNQMPTRRNDPTYMHYVERYWTEISKQAKGFMWKDGGPVISVQLENEYNLSGPGMGAEHISTLKALAIKLGFDTPYYTVTGWDGALYPRGEVVPVFAGYADEAWGLGVTKMAPNEVYTFRFNSRVAGDAGAQTAATKAGTAIEDMPTTPFLGAEFGPGVPIMYRRRALMQPDDIGAMLPVQLGSGVNLYGYYMYHGGRNPKGQNTTLEENALLGGYNDCPIINYDFQAPYGQYGQKHDVLNKIMPYHHFIRSFGDRLAAMAVHSPEKESKNRHDLETARFSIRSFNDSGFVFLNNHIRQYPMVDQKDIRFEVNLPSGKLVFPSKPVTVPSGGYFIWPFNFDLDGINLAWATAQPLARIESSATDVTYFFSAQEKISPEFALAVSDGQKINSTSKVQALNTLKLIAPSPGTRDAFSIVAAGKTIHVVVLPAKDAENIWMGEVAGKKRLVLTDDEVIFNANSLEFASVGDNNFKFGVFPGFDNKPKGSLALNADKTNGVFHSYSAKAIKKDISVTFTKTREEQKVLPINIGGAAKTALQPFPEQFGKSAAWKINVPQNALDGLADAYLSIDYQGDVGRLFSGTELLDDDFYSGLSWTIGLRHFPGILAEPLTLTVLPLRKDAPVYIDDVVKAALPQVDQVAVVKSVKVIPKYALSVSL